MSDIAVVILNWNGEKLLNKFLPSVVKFTQNARIIIIDNASTDNSKKFLENHYPKIEIIALKKNYGFAEGYNRGLKEINAKYYILLNSDIEVTQYWWQPLISLLENNINIAAVQPKILSYSHRDEFEYAGACGGFIDKYGYPFCRGRIFDTIEDDMGQYNNLKEVFWASGAALAIRADLFIKAGGFDTSFFAHMEEIDLCWRLQHKGYSLYCEPKSVVFHLGGGTLSDENPYKLYLNYRNNLFMLFKNLLIINLPNVIIIRLVLDMVSAFRFLIKGKFKNLASIIKAHIAFYKAIPSLIKKRKKIRRSKNNIIYKNSILWEYFIRGKKKFTDL